MQGKYQLKLITPPARRAWRSFKFAPFLFFFSVSEVGAALTGDTAEHCRFEPNIQSQFSSRISHQNTHFNMYTIQHLNSKKVLGAKILVQNVLERQILINSTAKER